MATPQPISVDVELSRLRFLPNRTPTTTYEERSGAFTRITTYRDGAVFAGYYAGSSEWECHPVGDEIVMVVDGETTITFLADDTEHSARMGAGEFVVVPQGTWHRFETPEAVKVLSVTPQPTDHRTERP